MDGHTSVVMSEIEASERGAFAEVPKRDLIADLRYQREPNAALVRKIAADWSWASCGVIIVAERDGVMNVVDGNHRVQAACMIDSIHTLPCLIFVSNTIKDDAAEFVNINTKRKHMSTYTQFKSMLVAEDRAAMIVDALCKKHRLRIVQNSYGTTAGVSCINVLLRCANDDPAALDLVLSIASALVYAESANIHTQLITGLWSVNKQIEGGLRNQRLVARMKQVGLKKIMNGIAVAIKYFTTGSPRVHAEGIINALNHGLRSKFELSAPKTGFSRRSRRDADVELQSDELLQ